MQKIKNEKGITLLILVITIIVILLISVPTIVNTTQITNMSKYTKLKDDLQTLSEAITSAYNMDDNISEIGPKYIYNSNSKFISQKNSNDDEIYYVIDVSILNKKLTTDIEELNYGLSNINYKSSSLYNSTNNTFSGANVYIVNNSTKTVYYTDGIEYNGKTYYRLSETYTSISIEPNIPKLMTGMTPIKFTTPTDTTEGTTVITNENDINWYNYSNKNWANAQTEDGSMWVWIPRFAYRINTSTQTCSIVFLIGTSDKYYDENGNIQTAKRCTTESQIINTTNGYTVHPAFTNESSINYRNGGWDSDLSGFWVAKFEAGYANSNNGTLKDSKNNNKAQIKASSVSYTQTTAWIASVENGGNGDTTASARNWLDGTYGKAATKIKYPTFQGLTYSMNYINYNDAYNISKAMNESGNIYGLSTSTDSHLMKNSEWGAVAYLAQSQYGLNGTNIYINNANLNNSTTSVYAITGCSAKSTADDGSIATTIDAINNRTANVNAWTQKAGQKSSSSGTIYGVYDLSGGTWERVAAYVNNGSGNLTSYGASVVAGGSTSTKYATVYPSTEVGSTDDLRSQANYEANNQIYGDAVRETSTAGTAKNAWYSDYSYFPEGGSPFFVRGGYLWDGSGAGLFFFSRDSGGSAYYFGFRAVLI